MADEDADEDKGEPASAGGSAPKAKPGAKGGDQGPITIKKYANRRLYNTATSSYVTLDHLCGMVKEGVDFAVYDAKTGEDITRSVLTQIIVEEEAKTGQNLLPISFLRQLISFYGDNMQQMMLPQYLDFSIRSFAENQEKMRAYMTDAMGAVFPFGQLEEMGKRNMEMFERAMRAFSPFANADGDGPEGAAPAPADAEDERAARVESLQEQLAEMQRQLKEMQKK
ncbi:MAG: polyhydroxyalkanoate synthesis repressor PhaR [Alphaproteobacteria bacterium]|nr:polyhydroxyalkanoate synthesis repressor PhaR [Alphaproteobacteria bacterium]